MFTEPDDMKQVRQSWVVEGPDNKTQTVCVKNTMTFNIGDEGATVRIVTNDHYAYEDLLKTSSKSSQRRSEFSF